MELTFVRDEEGFDALRQPWNQLLEQAVTRVPFLRHEYLRAWWSSLGGGEWPHGELWIAVARALDGDIVGLAPLFGTHLADGRPALLLLGSIEISDYLDVIATEGVLAEFCAELLEALGGLGGEAWQVVDLYNLPQDSPTLPLLAAAAEGRGWQVTREGLQPCPSISLDGGWEGYLSRLDKKQRHELRRKMRRAEAVAEGVRWRVVSAKDDLRAAMDALFQLMAYDPEKAEFLTSAMREQFQALALAAQEGGWLHLSFLEVTHEPAAALFCFDYGGSLWIYNSGIYPDYTALSPGWVLLGHVIRWAAEHGRREVDFMRGQEDYKYRLGGVNRYLHRLSIAR